MRCFHPSTAKTIPVAADGRIEGFLTNNPTQFTNDDPLDLDVTVSCDGKTLMQPFASTARQITSSAPGIYTVPGPGACGYGLAPTEQDSLIRCKAHLKGFRGNASMNSTNEYVFEGGAGGTVASGDYTSGGPDIAVATGPGTDIQISTFAVGPPGPRSNVNAVRRLQGRRDRSPSPT